MSLQFILFVSVQFPHLTLVVASTLLHVYENWWFWQRISEPEFVGGDDSVFFLLLNLLVFVYLCLLENRINLPWAATYRTKKETSPNKSSAITFFVSPTGFCHLMERKDDAFSLFVTDKIRLMEFRPVVLIENKIIQLYVCFFSQRELWRSIKCYRKIFFSFAWFPGPWFAFTVISFTKATYTHRQKKRKRQWIHQSKFN